MPEYNANNHAEQGGDRTVIGGSLDVVSGGELDIESGGALKIGGTAVTATAAELTAVPLSVKITDLSQAASAFVVTPHAGLVSKIYSVINGALTGSDAVLTCKIGGVAITGGALTITQSGSAAGDVDSATPSAANTVTAGQAIEIACDGGPSASASATLTVEIYR